MSNVQRPSSLCAGLFVLFSFAFSQTNDNNKLHSRDLDELKYEVQPVDVDAPVQNNEGNRKRGAGTGWGKDDIRVSLDATSSGKRTWGIFFLFASLLLPQWVVFLFSFLFFFGNAGAAKINVLI